MNFEEFVRNNTFSSSRRALKEYRQLGYKIGNEKGFAIFRQSKNEPINEIKQKASSSRKNIKKEPEKVKKSKKIIVKISKKREYVLIRNYKGEIKKTSRKLFVNFRNRLRNFQHKLFNYYFIGLVEYDGVVTANLSGFNNPNELGLIKAEFLRRHRGIEKFEYGAFSVSDNDFVIMPEVWKYGY